MEFKNFISISGPRNCIGQKFAMLEMKTTLATLLRHFKFKKTEMAGPIPVAEVVIKSNNGLHVIIEKRGT